MSLPASVPVQPVPRAPVVMRQRWENLLFLHWEWDAREIAETLPAGLEVDTFDGRAYLGVVPFFMRRVRPRFCPPVPGVSDFLELNLRTYVIDRHGLPGVWFYSLDCNQPIAVWAARTFFRLPYFKARMRAQTGPESELIYYDSCRAGTTGSGHFQYRPNAPAAVARCGSLEAFLVERYRLFAGNDHALYSGQVWHDPYRISTAEVPRWSAIPIVQAGFKIQTAPPDHVLFSAGVDVRIFPLARVAA